MSTNLSPVGGAAAQFLDNNGNPLTGGKLYTYEAGTTTPQAVYTTSAGNVAHANPIILDAAGRVPGGEIWLTANLDYKFSLFTSADVLIATWDNIVGINGTGVATNANAVTYDPAGAGAVSTTVQEKLRTGVDVSVFDFMTAAEIASVQSYSFGTDVTLQCQAALDAAHANNMNVYFPAGGYLVTGLTIPGTVDGVGTDDRNKGMRIYGQGFGEPFVHLNTGGTVIKSVTDAPVLQDILGTASSSNGTIRIDNIRFDGTSSSEPVVKLTSFYGLSTFHNCVVYQRGTGDGLRLGWGATVWVHECYVMNKDWASYALGAARVGTGIAYIPTADNGLVTISKCTSRGWLTAYQLAGGAGTAYAACIDKCEASVVYNGAILQSNADKCVVSNSYFEGGDGGVGINNLGDYNTIRDNLFFAGFATVIQDLGTSNKGTLIEGNLIAIGATVGGKGIDITSSATFGGYDKSITNNSFTYTAGTAGVKGVQISGTSPRLLMIGNSFDPRGAWTGAGSIKIDDQSVDEGPFGIITQENGDYEFPVLSSGALSLFRSSADLTESNVTANNLSIPNGSYFTVAATVATTVNRFSAGALEGRVVVFRTTNANTTFADTAYNQLAGGISFVGPGTITFFIDKVGAENYAYELCRTVF